MKSPYYRLYRIIRRRIHKLRNILNVFCYVGEFAMKDNLITYHVRPVRADQFRPVQGNVKPPPSPAIVMQGPVVDTKDFTLETIRMYKNLFPEAIMILSTWDDIEQKTHDKIKKENIEIVLNKKPQIVGHKNTNLQITSAAAGVARAKTLGAKYILKTRTDQRFYNPHLLMYLYHTLEAFPLRAMTRQKERLIFCSGTRRSDYQCHYHLSDMMIFGNTSDMEIYWQANLVTPDIDDYQYQPPEPYLMTEFLKKIGHELTGTIEDSDHVYADYCIILDLPMLDFYWYKNKRYREYKRLPYEEPRWHNVSFLEWLSLYAASEKKINTLNKN